MKKNRKLVCIKDNQLFYIALAFFVFMMLFNLLHSSLGGDELVEYNYSQKGIRNGNLYKTIITTFQPPLYNYIMHFWLELSRTFLWFRLFNVFCGVFAGLAIYGTVKRLTNPRLAAGVLFALGATYQWIYCIQECSEYTLMLTFLCAAFYFYVRTSEENGLVMEVFFILSCVGAMYSQYGAFFVITPLLLLHLVRKCLSRVRKDILKTGGMYLFSLVFFAIPLYMFFARIQMRKNAISENSSIVLSLENIRNLPFVFGKLMGYFVHLNNNTILSNIMTIIGGVVILFGIILLTRKSVSWLSKSLIIVLFATYVLFYWLVTFHIYAMVHPNQSSGYYSRYAYFFIPVFYVIIPLIFYQVVSLIANKFVQTGIVGAVSCIVAILLFIAYPSVLNNWHKTYDREFAEIWVYNAGFSETTYLIGTAKRGFNYYTNLYDYEMTGKILSSGDIDLINLPDSFWLWRTSWNGDMWQTAVDAATEHGYKVIIYADHGYAGQLAYCTK